MAVLINFLTQQPPGVPPRITWYPMVYHRHRMEVRKGSAEATEIRHEPKTTHPDLLGCPTNCDGAMCA